MIIESESAGMDMGRACSCLGVSRSGYLKWQARRQKAAPPAAEMAIRDEIQKIAVEFPRYGYRRVTVELRRRGFRINHKRAIRIMREDNLLFMKRLFKPVTTDSNHGFRVYPNLAKSLEVTGINQMWAADITYIQLLKEFVYLAVIEDVFSRRCIGWCLGRSMDTQLSVNALSMALSNRRSMNIAGLIHHSDQGVQYAAGEYTEMLESNGIRISMSRKGNPYDNAFVESFIKTLKTEEVYLKEYENFSDALANIKQFIEEVYNRKRVHSSIGYMTPDEFEGRVINTRVA
jgi:transposase InsO family protein